MTKEEFEGLKIGDMVSCNHGIVKLVPQDYGFIFAVNDYWKHVNLFNGNSGKIGLNNCVYWEKLSAK